MADPRKVGALILKLAKACLQVSCGSRRCLAIAFALCIMGLCGCVKERVSGGFVGRLRSIDPSEWAYAAPQDPWQADLELLGEESLSPAWNEIQNDDGTVTKFYYFRTGFLGVYMRLIRLHIDDINAPDIRISENPGFIVDPRPPGTANDYIYGSGIPRSGVTQGREGNPSPALADLLAVTAPERVIAQIDALLRAFLTDVPQIEISVQVLELADSRSFEKGLQGSVIPGTLEKAAGTFFKGGQLNLPLNLQEGAALNFSTFHDESAVDLFLEFVETRIQADITSAPKMTVLNGHRASIITGGETPVLSPSVNSSGEVTAAGVQFRQTGVSLTVTPFVLHEDLIQVEVAADVSSVTGQVTVAEFADGPLTNPSIARRAAYTVMNLRDGQTFALSGLVTSEEILDEIKFPILGDIPFLGQLFKQDVKTRRYSQVIYLISATLLKPGGLPGASSR